MRAAVIIVSYNVCSQLDAALTQLGIAIATVVVDNASQDGSAEMVRKRHPHVRLIAQTHNGGFSQAVNVGARALGPEPDALLLLNPDAVLTASALARLTESLARRPEAWAIGCRQVDANGHWQLSLGLDPGLLSELGRCLLQRRLDANHQGLGRLVDRHLLNRPRRVPWVAGSCLLIRRTAFERVGGFDERYFLYFEDIDFCLRLRRAGGHIYYDPSITALHRRGQSAQSAPKAAKRAYRASQVQFWAWHRGPFWGRLMQAYVQLRQGFA